MVDGYMVEVPPATRMLVVHNDDRPGMIGLVGTVLGEAGVSISSMAVAPSGSDGGGAESSVGGAAGGSVDPGLSSGTALMILATDRPVPGEVARQLAEAPGILGVHLAGAG